jgi:hypothetical protein
MLSKSMNATLTFLDELHQTGEPMDAGNVEALLGAITHWKELAVLLESAPQPTAPRGHANWRPIVVPTAPRQSHISKLLNLEANQ